MSETMQIYILPKVIQKNNAEQKACNRLFKSIYIIPQSNINCNTNVETMQIYKYILAYKAFNKKELKREHVISELNNRRTNPNKEQQMKLIPLLVISNLVENLCTDDLTSKKQIRFQYWYKHAGEANYKCAPIHLIY